MKFFVSICQDEDGAYIAGRAKDRLKPKGSRTSPAQFVNAWRSGRTSAYHRPLPHENSKCSWDARASTWQSHYVDDAGCLFDTLGS
jgi:hypothetical protein